MPNKALVYNKGIQIVHLLGIVVHAFTPSIQEAETGGFLCISGHSGWLIQCVPRQPELLSETLS